jgi:hypothetical protein
LPRTFTDDPARRGPEAELPPTGAAPIAVVRKGRGAVSNLAHRFESVTREADGMMPDAAALDADETLPPLATTVTRESARA